MRTTILALAAAATFGLAAPQTAVAQGPPERAQDNRERAQERGQERARNRGQGQAEARRQGQARDQGQAPAARQGRPGQGGPPAHARARRGPPDLEAFNRNLMERAVQSRTRRADGPRRVQVQRQDGQVRVVRDDGRTLLSLDAATADQLGYWRAAVVPPVAAERADAAEGRPDPSDARNGGGIFGTGGRYPADEASAGRDRAADAGAPAFCRSGEGHPVWGRDWCLDMGFGLGDGGSIWGVTGTSRTLSSAPPARSGTSWTGTA